jgi:hypothetical protein
MLNPYKTAKVRYTVKKENAILSFLFLKIFNQEKI